VFLPETLAGKPGELDSRIESQKKGLDELLRRYTDQHPDVIGTRRLIQTLEDERKQELAERAKAATASGQRPTFNANPVIQQLKIALAESEANVASLRARVDSSETRYAQLRAAALCSPSSRPSSRSSTATTISRKAVRESRDAARIGAISGAGRDAGVATSASSTRRSSPRSRSP
jgi:hypothetical protein